MAAPATPATTAMAPAAPTRLIGVVVAIVANTEDFLDPHSVPFLPRLIFLRDLDADH
jgi:hypothetical protein